MNPLTVLPAAARRWLYLVYAVLGPVLLWTRANGWTGANELELWAGLGTALGLVAAANTTDPTAVHDDKSPTGDVAGEASALPAGTPVEVTRADGGEEAPEDDDFDRSKPLTGYGDGI
jgi:hypothetical protein